MANRMLLYPSLAFVALAPAAATARQPVQPDIVVARKVAAAHQQFSTFVVPIAVAQATPTAGWRGSNEPQTKKPFPAARQQFAAFQPQGAVVSIRDGWRGLQFEIGSKKPFPAARQQFAAFQPQGFIQSTFPDGWRGLQFEVRFAKPFNAARQQFIAPARISEAPAPTPAPLAFMPLNPERFKKPFPVWEQQFSLVKALAPITPAAGRYWVGGTGTWDASDTTHWSATSGGAGGASVPTSTDDVFFDENSGGGTVTGSSAPNIRSFDSTGYTGTLAGSPPVIMGPVFTIGAATTCSFSQIQFFGGGTQVVTTNGVNISGGVRTFGGGTLSLRDAYAGGQSVSVAGGGAFTTNSYPVTSATFAVGGTGGTHNLGASVITLTGTANVWQITTPASYTVNAGTSLIQITDAGASSKTFQGAGKTYNNLILTGAGSGPFIIEGSNTFQDFKVDTPPHEVRFEPGTTQTVNSFTVDGTSLAVPITLKSKTNGSTWSLSCPTTISREFLAIRDSVGAGAGIPFYAANSDDQGNNTNWIFLNPTPTTFVEAFFDPRFTGKFKAALQRDLWNQTPQVVVYAQNPGILAWEPLNPERFARPFPASAQQWNAFQVQGFIATVFPDGWRGYQYDFRFAKPVAAALQRDAWYQASLAFTVAVTPGPLAWEPLNPERFKKPFPASAQQWSAFQPRGTIVSITPQGWWPLYPALFAKPFPASAQQFSAFQPRGAIVSITPQGFTAFFDPAFVRPLKAALQRDAFYQVSLAYDLARNPGILAWAPVNLERFKQPYSVSLQQFATDWPSVVPPGGPEFFGPPGAGKRRDFPSYIPQPAYGAKPAKKFRPIWDRPKVAELQPVPAQPAPAPPPLPPRDLFGSVGARMVLPDLGHVPADVDALGQRMNDARDLTDLNDVSDALALLASLGIKKH